MLSGVAAGNMSNALPLTVILIFIALYSWSFLLGKQVPYTYPTSERKKVLEVLAFNLLLARDKEKRGNLQPKNELLLALADELMANAEISPYQVDEQSQTKWYGDMVVML